MSNMIARRSFMNLAALGAASLSLPSPARAEQELDDLIRRRRWEASFFRPMASTALNTVPGLGFPTPPEAVFNNQTLRLVAPLSLGGASVRVKFSNAFGKSALKIGGASVALRMADAQISPGTTKVLTFGGETAVHVPAAATVVSDPVDLDVPDFSELAISIFLPGRAPGSTYQIFSGPTYIASGDQTMAANLSVSSVDTSRHFFVTGVDVVTRAEGTIVCLGDSLTATGWPEFLARRVAPRRTVVNAGYGGNRLLHHGWAQSAMARFDRDVLAQAGVSEVIIFEGINDIQYPSLGGDPSEGVSAADIIFALRQLVQRARDAGLSVYGATLTPFKGARSYNAHTEAKRQAVNRWLRSTRHFDGVFDFEAAVRDKANPPGILPRYDSGDHLHFNDAGLQALANAVDLQTLLRRRA